MIKQKLDPQVLTIPQRADGHREVLGLDVGDSENETFWREFLTGLVDRGSSGVRLVISDAHAGLVEGTCGPRRRFTEGARRAWAIRQRNTAADIGSERDVGSNEAEGRRTG